LMCGDDVQACEALLDPKVRADGVVSVVANLAPRGMRKLVDKGLAGDASATRVLSDSLHPLFGLISVTAQEQEEELPAVGAFEPAGASAVPQRSRNPVPLKEALGQLGLSAVSCRAPLGAMGRAGRRAVADILSELDQRAPDLLTPLSRAFDMNPARPVRRTTGGLRQGAERELAGRLP
jgi:4-hydroxy-tetrahydrodipicolinate synthase